MDTRNTVVLILARHMVAVLDMVVAMAIGDANQILRYIKALSFILKGLFSLKALERLLLIYEAKRLLLQKFTQCLLCKFR